MFEKIIIITGFPRSGTTWLGQIIDSDPNVRYRFQPIFSYAFKNAVNERSTKEEFECFFEGIYNSEDDFLLQKENKKKGYHLNFQKDFNQNTLAFKMVRYHYLLPYMIKLFNNLKILGIIRHPCGTINSWLTTPKEFPADADPMKEWRYGKCRNDKPEESWGFEKWKEVSYLYLDLEKEFTDQFKIVNYGDLVNDPIGGTEKIFEFLNLEFNSQTQEFLEASHKRHDNDSYSVFKDKKVKDKWQWELDKRIQKEIIDELKGTVLEQFL